MSHGSPLKITVENLGPIVTGDVELKPLTILVGRNNSGKTYFAQLLYSIFNFFFKQNLVY
jgi:predicted ATPase